MLYGIPGTTLDRTIGRRHGDAGYDYTHVFPMRNTDVPRLLAETAELVADSALLYPEASFSIRRRLAGGGIILEWLGGSGLSDSESWIQILKETSTAKGGCLYPPSVCAWDSRFSDRHQLEARGANTVTER
jgi:hypothetical protein